MENQDRPADAVGPVAGGAVALGGAAATLAYASNNMEGLDLSGLASTMSGSSPAPAKSSSAYYDDLSPEQASRFLSQATNGATRKEIDYLVKNGIEPWLRAQFAMPRGQTHYNWIWSKGSRQTQGTQANRIWAGSIWRQLISAPDQLRQRAALALLDIMVVSIHGLVPPYPQYAMAAYMDLLLDHAFRNYRELLGAITTSSAMGQFLTFLNNSKSDAKGSIPDENYARELMQLFTIGLYELNMDGTQKTARGGQPIETYTQDDVSQLARVFTGLRLPSKNLPEAHRGRLVMDASINETGASTFLGATISGGGMKAVDAALDVIFHHPNVPPFVAHALIQRLVTSNPSPRYIRRVASIFADNGSGVRGDMKAVLMAILLDDEARSDEALTAPHTGKLRDPVQRMTGWARAFDASSKSGEWKIGDTSSAAGGLAQCPGFSPSVFNFFRPLYTPPNSELQRRGLVAPELQIADEQSVIAYVNVMFDAIKKGAGGTDVPADYRRLMALAPDPSKLMDEVNLLLAAGQLSSATYGTIVSALNSIGTGNDAGRLNRIWTAILLTMASPDYLVLQ